VAASPAEAHTQAMHAEYGPLCEAMYLMMAADGTVSGEEREVLRGALRNLSANALRTADIDAMLEAAVRNVEEGGRKARLMAVAEELAVDRGRSEVAFVLAAAIAFADGAVADDENETLNALAEALSIDEDRAEALLDQVERDLAAQSPP
jgi:tellurite resistance protein